MPFEDDVRAGLSSRPKTLPAKYFYDALGSLLFDAICELPEYYLTRAEAEILAQHASDIIGDAQPVRLVELGSGSAKKTRYLIEAGLRQFGALAYDAIDISPSVLAATSRELQAAYPGLTVRGFDGEYYEGLRRFSQARRGSSGRTLAVFLGSNIGNFDPPQAEQLLRAIRAVLEPGDTLLLGTDLKKDKAQLEAAYDDVLGLTAAFNRNVLVRINRELGGHFDVRLFAHRAWYNEVAGRVEMHLVSGRDQDVAIDKLAMRVSFERGESIHSESSYKYSAEEVNRLARSADFELSRSWTDARGWFACNLLRYPG